MNDRYNIVPIYSIVHLLNCGLLCKSVKYQVIVIQTIKVISNSCNPIVKNDQFYAIVINLYVYSLTCMNMQVIIHYCLYNCDEFFRGLDHVCGPSLAEVFIGVCVSIHLILRGGGPTNYPQCLSGEQSRTW